MMNVPVTAFNQPQIFNNYMRYESSTYPSEITIKTEKSVDENFIKGLFQDPSGKLFERNNSQRQYFSVPVGGVPSEQGEFSQWLYGSEGNCRAGSIEMRYGVKYTKDSLLCTGYEGDGKITNFGRLTLD